MFLTVLVLAITLFSINADEGDKLIETEGRRFGVLEPDNPIFWFRLAEKNGIYDFKRVKEVYAIIKPHRIVDVGRINFPTSGNVEDRFQISKAPGDERGHLVPAQFSAPAKWYNLTPQNVRVNRNESYQSVTKEWFNAECEVRKFLDKGEVKDRSVTWIVNITYPGYSNRPSIYDLTVQFYQKGLPIRDELSVRVYNPFLTGDSTFYVCEKCRDEEFCKGKRKFLKKITCPLMDTCQPLS